MSMTISPSTVPAPADVTYLPTDPRSLSTPIAIIGCGGISAFHLAAYREAGYNVVALCDIVEERAIERRDEFFPDADVYTDHHEVLARTDVEVVDIATHVHVRPPLVRDALDAGKDVLSQKPFVRSIAAGQELIDYASDRGRLLAANQNGRWAPHFGYLLSAVRSGVIGEVTSADFWEYWPHDEVVSGNEIFSNMQDLILLDFGIHWFDMIAQIFEGKEATEVTARVKKVPGAVIPVPTNTQVIVDFDDAQASIRFRGSSHFDEEAGFRVEGTKGVISHTGPWLGGSSISVTTEAGTSTVELEGEWFKNGMHGTMAELLKAREEGRAPLNAAMTVLPSLQLCYAAIQSARTGTTVDPSTVDTADV
ncbi:Gfo/Idh/MocA family protein [Lacisediminihabitans sp. FW035]